MVEELTYKEALYSGLRDETGEMIYLARLLLQDPTKRYNQGTKLLCRMLDLAGTELYATKFLNHQLTRVAKVLAEAEEISPDDITDQWLRNVEWTWIRSIMNQLVMIKKNGTKNQALLKLFAETVELTNGNYRYCLGSTRLEMAVEQFLKNKETRTREEREGQDEDGQVLDPAVVRAKLIEVMEGMENQWDDDEEDESGEGGEDYSTRLKVSPGRKCQRQPS